MNLTQCKECTKCKEEKPLEEFSINRSCADGHSTVCKKCSRPYRKKWVDNNKELSREIARRTRLKRVFGLTVEEYDKLLEEQHGCCALCRRHHTEFKKRLAVDHIHSGPRAGSIRGLLCINCNHRLIGSHTDPELLRRMADYLERDTGYVVPDAYIKPKRRRKKKHL